MPKQDVTNAIDSYKEFLTKAQVQHERTIKEAYAQLQELIAQSARPAVTVEDPPQSVWITGTDGEPFLIMNKSAADIIMAMIERLKEVVAELAKMQIAKTK
jgi:hypothetical protein